MERTELINELSRRCENSHYYTSYVNRLLADVDHTDILEVFVTRSIVLAFEQTTRLALMAQWKKWCTVLKEQEKDASLIHYSLLSKGRTMLNGYGGFLLRTREMEAVAFELTGIRMEV